MKRISTLLILFLFLLSHSAYSQGSSDLIYLVKDASKYLLYSSNPLDNTCPTPYNFKGNNDIIAAWRTNTAITSPYSIGLSATAIDTILYVTDSKNNLYFGKFSTVYGLLDGGTAVTKAFPDAGSSFGLTVDSRGVVYSAVGDFIDSYDPANGISKQIGKNTGWQIGGDLIFWRGKAFEVSRDDATKKIYKLFEIDTTTKPTWTYKDVLTFTTPIFGIASIKRPCNYNQPYALGNDGSFYPINYDTKNKTYSVGALATCNILTPTAGSSVFDAASTAEAGIDQRPTPPANPVTPNNLCKGQPFSFKINVNDPLNDTLRWYTPPNVPPNNGTPSVYSGMPFINTNIIGDSIYLITEFNKTTKCESDPTPIEVNIHPYPAKALLNPIVDTICNGATIKINSTAPLNGNQWYFNNAILNGETNNFFNASKTGSYFNVVTNQWGCSTNTDTATVKVLSSSLSYSRQAFCNSPSPSFEPATTTGDNVGFKFSSSPVGLVLNGTGSIDLQSSKWGKYVVTYSLNGGNFSCPYTSNVEIDSIIVPTISISSNNTTICPGTTVTFTANVTGAGTSPNFQWLKNGVAISGATTNPYITSILADKDVIKCILTSNALCVLPAVDTSTGITINVTPNVVPSISISGNNTICPNTTVTFTATANTAGSYQWTKNGNNVGTNIATYTDAALVNNDVIKCILTSSSSCAVPNTATSTGITVAVTPNITPSISITGNNNICSGTSVTFTSSINGGGTAPSYQWTKNGNNVGTNAATYIDGSLINNDVIKCILTSNSTCAVPNTATSTGITVSVTANVTPTITIIGNNTICTGTTVTFTATANTTGSYQWTKNGNTIVGATSSTYTSSTLADKDVIACNLTSNATCAVPTIATSNNIKMSVSASIVPNVSISGTNAICTGTSVSFTANANTAGSYQWTKNGTNVGTNSTTYTDASLADKDAIVCVFTSSSTCAVPTNANSNAISMTVNAKPVVSVTGPNSLDVGQNITLTGTPAGGAWTSTPTSIATVNAGIVTGVSSGLATVTYTITDPLCGPFPIDHPVTVNSSNLYIPNLFSPNGDGHNDKFYIHGNPGSYKSVELHVFSSWGTLIFEKTGAINDAAAGWDGTYSGKAQPSGVYVYVAKLTTLSGTIITKKGSITLTR